VEGNGNKHLQLTQGVTHGGLGDAGAGIGLLFGKTE